MAAQKQSFDETILNLSRYIDFYGTWDHNRNGFGNADDVLMPRPEYRLQPRHSLAASHAIPQFIPCSSD